MTPAPDWRRWRRGDGAAVAAGMLAAGVGYASTVAVVIQGLAATGASPAAITSGLGCLCLLMGLLCLWLSLRLRMPISVVWSTPGMALLAGGGVVAGGYAAALGAFIVAGVLIVLAGLWRPLGRWVGLIPQPIAAGMLAGILLKLCLAPFVALQSMPITALAILAAWLLVGRLSRLWAVPAAVAIAVAAVAIDRAGAGGTALVTWLPPTLVLTRPTFDIEALLGIGLPLFLVTMASQNVPGFAVLAVSGYRPDPARLFRATGAASILGAATGAPTLNLAAITAALCAGPDAHADPARRWIAGAASGVAYVALAALAGVATQVVTQAPPVVIETVAGLALIGAFGNAMKAAVDDEALRLPALLALLVTASGIGVAGIGAAFWGLVLGLAVHGLALRGHQAARV